jgi:hypothetical protein
MKLDECLSIVAKWGGTLKFFPSDPHARLGIVEEISEITTDIDRVRWLVSRIPKIHSEWPGMREVRAAYCGKYKPDDGIEVYSLVYPDGIPSEKAAEPLAIAGATQKQLTGEVPNRATPEEITAAQSLRDFIRDAAVKTDMNRIGKPAPKVREIPALPPGVKPITQADIDKAKREMLDKKAREEAGMVPQ